MVNKNKIRHAPRLKIKRIPKSSCIHPAVNAKIEADANRFNCSKSFVIATILAFHYKIDAEGNYKVK